jgi:hypothetical protein
MLVVIAIPRLEEAQASQKRSYTGRVSYTASGLTVKCPLCAEWVSGEAKVCKHCGRDIADEVRGAIEAERQAEDAEHSAAIAEHEKRRAETARLEQETTRRERELFEAKSRKRRELLASKRFRVRALVGSGVALAAVTAGTFFVLTTAAENAAARAATEAATVDRLDKLYLRSVEACAGTAGTGINAVKTRYRIVRTTLVLNYKLSETNVDDFVDCMASSLTGYGGSDLERGLPQERSSFILLRSETGASLTIMPTP